LERTARRTYYEAERMILPINNAPFFVYVTAYLSYYWELDVAQYVQKKKNGFLQQTRFSFSTLELQKMN